MFSINSFFSLILRVRFFFPLKFPFRKLDPVLQWNKVPSMTSKRSAFFWKKNQRFRADWASVCAFLLHSLILSASLHQGLWLLTVYLSMGLTDHGGPDWDPCSSLRRWMSRGIRWGRLDISIESLQATDGVPEGKHPELSAGEARAVHSFHFLPPSESSSNRFFTWIYTRCMKQPQKGINQSKSVEPKKESRESCWHLSVCRTHPAKAVCKQNQAGKTSADGLEKKKRFIPQREIIGEGEEIL